MLNTHRVAYHSRVRSRSSGLGGSRPTAGIDWVKSQAWIVWTFAATCALVVGCGRSDEGSHQGERSADDPNQERVVATPFTAAARSDALEVLNPMDPTRPFYFALGAIPFDTTVVHEVRMRNLEEVPITIQRTMPACACSRVKRIKTWDAQGNEIKGNLGNRGEILRVAAGAEFELGILIDAGRVKPNAQKLAILRVHTDSKVQPLFTFEIRFFPEKLFETSRPELNLGDIPLGGGTGDTLQIFSRAALNQALLLDVVETSPGIAAELELITGFDSNWNLHVTTLGLERLGPWQGSVTLSTTDRDGAGAEGRLVIPVLGKVVEPVQLYPPHLTMGSVDSAVGGQTVAEVVGLAPGHHVAVGDLVLEGPSAPYLQVEAIPIAENSFGRAVKVELRLHVLAGAPAGPIDATLTVPLIDEAQESITRHISGEVREQP